jgi:UPF0755 protein
MKERLSPFVWAYWLMIAVVILSVLSYEALTFVRNIPPTARDSAVVFIPPGQTVRDIAELLNEVGVLKSSWKLRILARIRRKQAALKPGEYRFDVPSPPWSIINALVEGKVILHRVTLPEGLTMREIAQVLSDEKLVELEAFLSELKRPELLTYFNIPGPTFEGFLFPDTYYFSRVDGAQKMIETMVARFAQAATSEDERKASTLGLNKLQWVTLASIIEKESSIVDEQPIVSSVFHNRLKRKMRLQSDPTVIYGIPNFNGNITKKDLLTPTPYNTYTQVGLPPGPIANPGATSLKAAANPATTEYLYFVANRQGRHVFTKTYQEHLAAVATYQLSNQYP